MMIEHDAARQSKHENSSKQHFAHCPVKSRKDDVVTVEASRRDDEAVSKSDQHACRPWNVYHKR